MSAALIHLSNLGFAWPGQPELLDIDSFTLQRGESLFLKGPSGSGKTTLLGLLGGVQKPNRGSIRLLDQNLSTLSASTRDRFRVDHTGYIFQQFNLLPFLSMRENVELPCHFSKLRAMARYSAMAAWPRPPAPCSPTSVCTSQNCCNAAPVTCRSASNNASPPPAH